MAAATEPSSSNSSTGAVFIFYLITKNTIVSLSVIA